MSAAAHVSDEGLPAWSLAAGAGEAMHLQSPWPERVTREWAWGGATGAGVRVCVLDSGVELDHPRVGTVQRSVAVTREDGEIKVADDEAGDLCGHGTACAGIIRSLAPECELTSVRVLGAGYTGSAAVLLAGLEWAIDQRFDIVNMSLSTTRKQYVDRLHELADAAYFRRTMLIASAHNMPVESFPWRFASVVSVGSHESDDPYAVYANPRPPVEFFARGLNVEIAWLGGATITATGNSFATPHVTGLCTLILSKHRDLTPFQLKSVLHLTAANVG
ncbi:MAG TPA: S8 family serine peptidase [Gaiellaceae bacterium]|jgi:subtilisin family serine protease|nr:S8 family serine peptidase [Gaiellaceae bacterium]